LKRFNIQAFDKINCLEGKIKELNIQNQSLRNQISQHDERDKIVISLIANLLKKYGIPPSELSCFIKDGNKEGIFQGFEHYEDSALLFNNLATTEVPLMSTGNESDVNNYLNIGVDGMYTQSASTVLFNSRTNIDEKPFVQDMNNNAGLYMTRIEGEQKFCDCSAPMRCPGGVSCRYRDLRANRQNSGSRSRLMMQNDNRTLMKRGYGEMTELELAQGQSYEYILKKFEMDHYVNKGYDNSYNNSYNNSYSTADYMRSENPGMDYLNLNRLSTIN
jgi:hypothetical protein